MQKVQEHSSSRHFILSLELTKEEAQTLSDFADTQSALADVVYRAFDSEWRSKISASVSMWHKLKEALLTAKKGV